MVQIRIKVKKRIQVVVIPDLVPPLLLRWGPPGEGEGDMKKIVSFYFISVIL